MGRPQAMLTEVEERWPKQRWEGMETHNGRKTGGMTPAHTVYHNLEQGFSRCGPETSGESQDLLRGPQGQNYFNNDAEMLLLLFGL